LQLTQFNNSASKKERKINMKPQNLKSALTAIFLTVALVSSAVEAGVIPINGTIAGSEIGTPFPNPAEGIYVNGRSCQPTRRLVHSHCFIRSQWTSLSRIRHLGTLGEVV
jgi:hypothetical protein